MKRRSYIVVDILAMGILIIFPQLVNAQWVHLGQDASQFNAFCVKGSNIFAGNSGLASDEIFISSDNGTTWMPVISGLKSVRAFAVSGSNIFAGTDSGIFMSANDGFKWTAVDSGLWPAKYLDYIRSLSGGQSIHSLAASGSNIFAGTEHFGVYLSTDNGTSWTAVDNGLPSPPVHSVGTIKTCQEITALAVSGSNIFAGMLSGVYLTTNNGTNWRGISSPKHVFSLAVSDSNIFIGTDTSGVYVSTYNGIGVYRAVNSGLTNHEVHSLLVSGSYIFAGTGDGVFLSANNGTSWTAVNSGLTMHYVFSLAVSGNYLFAGTNGGIFRRPLSDFATGTIDGPARQLSNYNTFKIFYKGSNVSIAFSLPRRERVNVTIFNLSGHVVQSLTDKQFEAGARTLSWDTKSLPPGCYTVRMQTEANTYAKNFMLAR